jgi:DNA invertase Pin-like site-specific DNA recombinase
MKCYSYARFSSAAQAKGDSLRRQFDAAEKYATEHGLELDTPFVDRGLSGYTGANRDKGDLKKFLDMIEAGMIPRGSYLLVDSMDRLSRLKPTEAANQLLGIALAGVKVVTLNNNNVFDENATLTDIIIAVAEIDGAHKYAQELGRKVGQAHRESKRKAREEGRVWSKTGPEWLELDPTTRKFKPIPERVALVKRIFEMCEAGMGTRVIAAKLNLEGIKSFRSEQKPRKTKRARGGSQGDWYDTSVLKVLKSRAILGEYQPRFADGSPDGESALGYYGEPVIDPALFHSVQAILAANTTRPGGRRSGVNEVRNLFQGLGTCSECGGTVGQHIRSKDKKPLLMCIAVHRHACENRRRYDYKAFEHVFFENVSQFEVAITSSRKSDDSELIVAIGERDNLKTKIQNLLDMIEDGDALIRERYRARVEELKQLEKRIETLKAIKPKATNYNINTILEIRQQLNSPDADEVYRARSAISLAIRNVVDYILFDPNGDITVVILEGLKNYKFNGDKFIGEASLNSPPPSWIEEKMVGQGGFKKKVFENIDFPPFSPEAEKALSGEDAHLWKVMEG